jgi:carbonic anhydrase
MGAIDDALKANEEFYRNFTSGMLAVQPAKKLAVVTCMDSRMDLFALLGLKHGDAHMIRNAGGIVTDDVIRSLIVSHHLLGTQEVMVINHTDCGLNMIQDDEFRRRMQRASGTAAIAPAAFHAFSDIEDNVREQVQKVDTHPWLSKEMVVRGFVYDVRTGRLSEVRTR